MFYSQILGPLVLTISLKRFDNHFQRINKITRNILYPELLKLEKYMCPNAGVNSEYQLNAVVIHQGFLCSSGHYYSYIKNSNEMWYQVKFYLLLLIFLIT